MGIVSTGLDPARSEPTPTMPAATGPRWPWVRASSSLGAGRAGPPAAATRGRRTTRRPAVVLRPRPTTTSTMTDSSPWTKPCRRARSTSRPSAPTNRPPRSPRTTPSTRFATPCSTAARPPAPRPQPQTGLRPGGVSAHLIAHRIQDPTRPTLRPPCAVAPNHPIRQGSPLPPAAGSTLA